MPRVVGIEPLLGRRLSKGPMEQSTASSYDQANLDVRFLLELLKDHPRLNSIFCIPDWDICIVHGRHGLDMKPYRPCDGNVVLKIRSGVIFTGLGTSGATLWLPPNWDDILARCRLRGVRFAICNCGLYAGPLDEETLKIGHANSIVVDLKNKRVERYEPDTGSPYDEDILRLVRRHMRDWDYVCTNLGLQNDGTDAFHGMCVTFSLDAVLHRILNPHLSPHAIKLIMTRASPSETRRRILRLNATALDKVASNDGR
jgi:hypothetical protein